MLNPPMTQEEAEAHIYGRWSGNPKGHAYRPGRCAYSVWRNFISGQCSRIWGHGPGGLYCKQHAKMVENRG